MILPHGNTGNRNAAKGKVENLACFISIPITQSQKQQIREAANTAGVGIAQFCRDCITSEMEKPNAQE